MDLVQRRALGTYWSRLLNPDPEWLAAVTAVRPNNAKLYERAMTHGSFGPDTYERLEFLGDRVLGLVMARWLYELHDGDAEGKLSFRYNNLVSGSCCAAVGRRIGIGPFLRLGKQARDDGASDSDNVLGDVVEALIGALFLDHGLEAAEVFIRRHWGPLVNGQDDAPRHPKSALQEWAAAHNRRPPAYEVIERSGPQHAPRFTVRVSLGSAGHADAVGTSKQDAETAAASALLEKLAR